MASLLPDAKKRKLNQDTSEVNIYADKSPLITQQSTIIRSYEDSITYFSGVPSRFLTAKPGQDSPPCIIGIDEAGRGCVLGAMLYGAAFWLEAEDELMSAKGYDDSKGLTPEVREKMYKGIKEDESENMGFVTVSIPAHTISCKMMRQNKYSLNKMSWDCCVDMVRRIKKEGVNIVKVYVDTVGDPEIYESWLTRQFQGKVFLSKCLSFFFFFFYNSISHLSMNQVYLSDFFSIYISYL